MRLDILELTTKPSQTRYKHLFSAAQVMSEIIKNINIPSKIKDRLINTALLHDVGYSHTIGNTRYHAYDGYKYLLKNFPGVTFEHAVLLHGYTHVLAPDDIINYTSSIFINLSVEEELALALLNYCDWRSDGFGNICTIDERAKDVASRHSPSHSVTHFVTVQKHYAKETEKSLHKLISKFESLY